MSDRWKAITILLAFLIMGLLTIGYFAVRSSDLSGCRRDNVLRSALRAGSKRTYVLRIAQADGDLQEVSLATLARDASLVAYSTHGC